MHHQLPPNSFLLWWAANLAYISTRPAQLVDAASPCISYCACDGVNIWRKWGWRGEYSHFGNINIRLVTLLVRWRTWCGTGLVWRIMKMKNIDWYQCVDNMSLDSAYLGEMRWHTWYTSCGQLRRDEEKTIKCHSTMDTDYIFWCQVAILDLW